MTQVIQSSSQDASDNGSDYATAVERMRQMLDDKSWPYEEESDMGISKSKPAKQKTSGGTSKGDAPFNLSDFRKQALKEMNDYRKKHQAPPLKLDDKLNSYAQQWADELARTNTFRHRSERKYGENIAMGSGDRYKEAVKMWYDEVQNYNFKRPGFTSGTGHFSQVVWKSSKTVGVGVATSKSSGMTVVVANFDPPGNFMGQFEENVLPKA